MSHYVKKYFNLEKKGKKLLIFLHGYNGCVQDIEYTLNFFKGKIPDLNVVAPEAAMACEKNSEKRQWYSLWAHDPQDERRKIDTPVEKLIEIYNRFGDDLSENALEINAYIDSLQQELGVDNRHTIIAGFSQGAMLACYVALSRPDFDGKCLMFSGVVAGADCLAKEQKSFPDIYLLHGKDDVTVSYKTVDFSETWLREHGLKPVVRRYEALAHKMRDDELDDAVAAILAD